MATKERSVAGLFCKDTHFYRLLEIQLGLCGAALVLDLQKHPQERNGCDLWLVDLDDFPYDTLPPRPNGCFLFGWTREEGRAYPPTHGMVVWHRPFSMKMFETLMGELLQGTTDRPLSLMPAADVYHGVRVSATEKEKSPVLQVTATGDVVVKGATVSLTGRERALFDSLWQNRGQTVSKDVLRACLSLAGEGVDTNALEVYICFLRRKLEKPTGRKLITTVRGVGYQLENE